MTGPLADAPACPPFPELTDFERRALESMAPQLGQHAQAFLKQVASANVIDRINTLVGFYTRVNVDRVKCSPVPLREKGAHFEVGGMENGIGVLIWDVDGYLETIEGWTVDKDTTEGVDLADLKFIQMTFFG